MGEAIGFDEVKSVEDRLAALEQRLGAAEDHLQILNLLNSYGPLVDSGTGEPAAELWLAGGGYSRSKAGGGTARAIAPEDLVAMYASDGHRTLVDNGVSHLTATPIITVDGDSAHAVGYSFVVLRESDRWILWRAAINEWSLARTPEGWRIAERLNRVLDGSQDSHDVMRKVLG